MQMCIVVYGINRQWGSHEVRGKKLGIVGYGHIGSQLSIIAESLGMEVYFYDIENKLPLGNAKQLHTLEELLGSCDVISLHVPDLPSTRNLMSAERIAQLKQDSIFDQCSTWYGSGY